MSTNLNAAPANTYSTPKATHFINLAFPKKGGGVIQLNPVRLTEENANQAQLISFLEAEDFKPTAKRSLEDEQTDRLKTVIARMVTTFRSATPEVVELDLD